jgi:hypothetical protein
MAERPSDIQSNTKALSHISVPLDQLNEHTHYIQ